MKLSRSKWRQALPGALLLSFSAIGPAVSDRGVLFVSNRDGALQSERVWKKLVFYFQITVSTKRIDSTFNDIR